MKLTNLNIDSHKHLENIHFNFTYPAGHPKAGKPLDKICLIGQSATGKTSILELIKDSLIELNRVEVVNGNGLFGSFPLGFDGKVELLNKDIAISLTNNKIIYGNKIYEPTIEGVAVATITNVFAEYARLLFFSSELISNDAIAIFSIDPLNVNTFISEQVSQKKISTTSFDRNSIYEFSQEVNQEMWLSLLKKILDYRKSFTLFASQLISKGTIGDITKLNQEYVRWAQGNENPLIKFANYFNPILNKLKLEVDLVNTEYFVPIKSNNSNTIIPTSGLSTGTKGLLLSMFPLFEIDTNNAMILIDEPERSLFPDMQVDLMGHYQRIAPDAQFIVATHSPFIAAAFEPEERFILYFDESGKVAVRQGESPIGDDPNDILRNDFKINYYNEFGKKAYQAYLQLTKQVSAEKAPEKKKQLIATLAALGDKYNF